MNLFTLIAFLTIATHTEPAAQEHGELKAPTLTRVSKTVDSFLTVNRDGVLKVATVGLAEQPPVVIELAVRGLRPRNDVGQPISWTISSNAIHFEWLYWDERGDVNASVFVNRLTSLQPVVEPLAPAPTWPTRDSVMPINRMRLYWKIAKRYPDTEVGMDFVVDDGAVYTFIARIKDPNVMRHDCVTTWTIDMRDVEPAERITRKDHVFQQQLPLPIHLVKAAGGKYVIDGALGVHRLGDGALTAIGSLKPTKDSSAEIVLIRDDDAGTTAVAERIGEELIEIEFVPAEEGAANPFGKKPAPADAAAVVTLLR